MLRDASTTLAFNAFDLTCALAAGIEAQPKAAAALSNTPARRDPDVWY